MNDLQVSMILIIQEATVSFESQAKVRPAKVRRSQFCQVAHLPVHIFFIEIIRVALLPMSIGKSATINGPANVRPDNNATVSLLPVALLPVIRMKQ